MQAAIICKDKEILKQINRMYYPKLKKSDHYFNVKQFKECYMIYYNFLFIHNEISNHFSQYDWQEIKRYCQKKGITVLIYNEKERKTELLNEFEKNKHMESEFCMEDETVELRPLHHSADQKNIEKIEVIKTIYSNIPQKNIGIVNLSQRAGSTFVTLNMAKALSDNGVLTSVIEIPFKAPYIFDYLGIQQKLLADDINFNNYLYINDVIEKVEIKKKKLLYEDCILWMVCNPLRVINKSLENQHIHNIIKLCKNTSVNLCDLGSNLLHSSFEELLIFLDVVLLIVDPLPSEIILNEKTLKKFKNLQDQGLEGYMIINKYCKGVHMKELTEYLECSPIAYIPFINAEYIYEAVYNYKIPYELPKVKALLNHDIQMLIEKVLFNEKIKISENKANKYNPLKHLKKMKVRRGGD
ncbi:MAG: hypothetical protein MJA31_18465 [Clostridia bacterium]|nr:hypothetical protein [Clostridia bacterium]